MRFDKLNSLGVAALLFLSAGCSAQLGWLPEPAPGAGSSTAGTPPRPVRVLPAGGADEMICHLPEPFFTMWCDAPQVVVRHIPDGAAILLRQGDPIRVGGKEPAERRERNDERRLPEDRKPPVIARSVCGA
ncbi:hypothetical protein ACLQ3K_26145 [Tsukamurella sp. DT100]|uniref:hypothetical protein n=1 Tax=Tsukamurella sp. DT100 TaxID=3393415 RepID=UPI003CEE9597